MSVDREPIDWLDPAELGEVLSELAACVIELGRPDVPYPTVGFPSFPDYPTAATLPRSSSSPVQQLPPYPPEMLTTAPLPAVLVNADLPTEDPPIPLRSIEPVVEREEQHHNLSSATHVMDDSESMLSDDGSEAAEQVLTLLAERNAAASGFTIRQIHLPAPPSGRPRLGIKLATVPGSMNGLTVTRIHHNSPVASTELTVGDRILGVNDRLLLSYGGDKSAKELLWDIESSWVEHSAKSETPFTLTVVAFPNHSASNTPEANATTPVSRKESAQSNGSVVAVNGFKDAPSPLPSCEYHFALRGSLFV